MKLDVFVALSTLAFSSSLVLAAPINFDMQDLAMRRDSYEVGDFAARDFALGLPSHPFSHWFRWGKKKK